MTGYMDCPPAYFSATTMFARDGRWMVCTLCGAHLPMGADVSVAGDLHWTFHNAIEDRLRKLEGKA